jgi:hypothetical protein
MKVYLVIDPKYGTQAAFAKEGLAKTAAETGYYDMSGHGCYVDFFEVETEVAPACFAWANKNYYK